MTREIISNTPPEDLVREVQFKLLLFEVYMSIMSLGPPIDTASDYEDEINYTVLVNKTPRGEAPEEVRQAWQELILPNCRRLKSDTLISGIVTGQIVSYSEVRGYYQVNTLDAMKALIENGTEKDYKAALWFLEQPHLQSVLVFCADEVLVVNRGQLPKNRSYLNPRSN